jgi:hypothetical protein
MFLRLCFLIGIFPAFPFSTKTCKQMKISEICFSREKTHRKRAARCFWCDVLWKNLRLLARGQRCQNKVSFDGPRPEHIE